MMFGEKEALDALKEWPKSDLEFLIRVKHRTPSSTNWLVYDGQEVPVTLEMLEKALAHDQRNL